MKFNFWSWNNGLSKKIKVLKTEEDLQDEKNESLRKKTKWLIIGLAVLVILNRLFKVAVLLLPLWIALGLANAHDVSLISLSQENFDSYWYWTLGFIPWLFELEIFKVFKKFNESNI